MTNLERLQNAVLTAEKAAEFITKNIASPCGFCKGEDGVNCWYAQKEDCKTNVKLWLESEIEDD